AIVDQPDRLSRATLRGGVRIDELTGNVQPVAYEAVSKNPARWGHGVALCLPTDDAGRGQRTTVTELGPDEKPLRESDKGAVLFDMGLSALGGSCQAVDFCVRTNDPELIATLRSVCGRSILDPESPAMGAILQAHPHRVALTKLGRTEVYQLIGGPATGGKSPPGPHTHVLPKLMKSGRTHSANQPIPDGFVPCAMMYPGNPLLTSMGEARPFAAGLHDAFQELFQEWGRDEQRDTKNRAADMIAEKQAPEGMGEPETRSARVALRVLCRQLRADPRAQVDPHTLASWSASYDGGQAPETDAIDATAVGEGEGH
ncbi:MAG: hypothetical protein AAGF32_09590, partial [Pseudomonadota bacterium]